METGEALAAGGRSYPEFSIRNRDHFLFRTYRDVLRLLGRPDQISRDETGPTFRYRLDVPGEEREIKLHIGFADGYVFEVDVTVR